MVDYSDKLRLTLMAQGEFPDTWWDKMINNLLLVEQGIDHLARIDLPSSGAYFLTLANGNLTGDEARHASLTLRGEVTGSLTIRPAPQPKLYYIRNATTGSGEIFMQIGTGGFAVLNRSEFSIVLCDGVDCHLLKMSYEQDVLDNESAIATIEQQLDIMEAEFSQVESTPPAYPVGALFFSTEATDPNTSLGYGTWVMTSRGRAIFGAADSDPDFNRNTTPNGGESSLTLSENNLPSHNHTGTLSPIAGHTHSFSGVGNAGTVGRLGPYVTTAIPPTQTKQTNSAPNHNHTGVTSYTGGTSSITKIPPYLVVYIWQRLQ